MNHAIQNKLLENENINNNNNNNKIDIIISNVVCSYSTRCHLNLRRIAMEGMHVEYKRENNMVNMRLRKPLSTATIWSSGKITCTGATSEQDAYIAARRFCRLLQKMKFKVKLSNYRVVNVLGTCSMPFDIDLNKIANEFKQECSYEPELHPGATFKIKEFRATLKLFTTGSITLTAPSVQLANKAIHFIYPVLQRFKKVSQKYSSNDGSNLFVYQTEQQQQSSSSSSSTSSSFSNLQQIQTQPPQLNNLLQPNTSTNNNSNSNSNNLNLNNNNNNDSTTQITNQQNNQNNLFNNFNLNFNYLINHHHHINHINHINHLNHHHHHHMNHHHINHHTNNLSSHCFNDNLLIDNVYEDFLQ